MKIEFVLKNHQNQKVIVDDNMSNLTSASGEQASGGSSGNMAENFGTFRNRSYFIPTPPPPPPPPPHQGQAQAAAVVKKKRNQPGKPDPEAEVIALSPKTLMATNRFVCDICHKGFQRDQNLQLHRRGHNLPFKLKQRNPNEKVRKKVYVCPEEGCVHHDPSRALGDLTGIKKHFCRKHGEKKYKCNKCSKTYAVQSDWKAHSKTCGTREYRCNCGSLFSRRDSFITHRAFCDALAEETAKAVSGLSPLLSIQAAAAAAVAASGSSATSHLNNLQLQIPQFNGHNDHLPVVIKKEQELQPDFPPWLSAPGPNPGPANMDLTPSWAHELTQAQAKAGLAISPSNPTLGPTIFQAYNQTAPSPASLSATALLQKAAQIGATSSSRNATRSAPAMLIRGAPHNSFTGGTVFGLNLASHEQAQQLPPQQQQPNFLHEMMMMNTGFGNSSAFADDVLGAKEEKGIGFEFQSSGKMEHEHFLMMRSNGQGYGVSGSGNGRGSDGIIGGGLGGNGGMTRDFLGLKALPHSDFLSMAGLGNCINNGGGTSPSQE